MTQAQSYKSHRRYMPAYHFFVLPILVANFLVQLRRFVKDQTFDTGWLTLVALALVVLGFTSRVMALTAQNRVIRLEERLRLMRLMPVEEHSRIGELATRQLIGLRFASDSEVADLARRCLNGELKSGEDVKRNVQGWREDYLRV